MILIKKINLSLRILQNLVILDRLKQDQGNLLDIIKLLH